jgi:hypothetical protein
MDWNYAMRFGFTGLVRRWWGVHVLGYDPDVPVFKLRLDPAYRPPVSPPLPLAKPSEPDDT